MRSILNHLSEIPLLFICCFRHFGAPDPFQLPVFRHRAASKVSITFLSLISLPSLPPSVFHPGPCLASWGVRVFYEAKRSARWAVLCVQIIRLLGRRSICHNCLCVGPLMSKKTPKCGKEKQRESTCWFTPAFLLVAAGRFGGSSGEESGGAKAGAFPFPFKAPPKLL